jgi:hypothetical protein
MVFMTDPDLVIYGALILIALFVGALSWWAIGLARRTEAQSQALTVEQLRLSAPERWLQGPMMWGVWFGLTTFDDKRLVLRDASGAWVTEVIYHALPVEGVIRYFDLDGERYEYVKEAPILGRMWLREASSGKIVLSCDHTVRYRAIYRGTSDSEIVRLHNPNLFTEIGALTLNGEKMGQLSFERRFQARVLSLQQSSLSRLEQCFVMLTAG